MRKKQQKKKCSINDMELFGRFWVLEKCEDLYIFKFMTNEFCVMELSAHSAREMQDLIVKYISKHTAKGNNMAAKKKAKKATKKVMKKKK